MEDQEVKDNKKILKILKKKEVWISCIIGLLLGAAIMTGILCILPNKNTTVATFKGGKITKNELYNEMEKYYSISYVLELADKEILESLYTLTDEQLEEVNDQADEILNLYTEYYGYTEEEFLEDNGFDSKEEFIDYMKLDYRRNLYCIDYYKTLIQDEDIQNYYNEDVYGKINTKHILISVLDDTDDAKALATTNKILNKLKNGTSFDDVAEEYEDEAAIEEVDFDNFNEDELDVNYVEASKSLEKGEYSKEAVKTKYGYHIIYCINKEDKPALDSVKDDIVEILGEDLEAEDQYIRYKALIKLREDNKLDFKSKKYKKEYKEYCDEINGND